MTDPGTQASGDPIENSGAETAMKAVQAERDEYLNSWKRAAADFINYKKDEAKRVEQLVAYAQADLVKDLLPILDSFDLGLQAVAKDEAAYKGLVMIQQQLQEVLRKRGVVRIPVSPGDAFDPAVHEAMMEMAVPPDAPNRAKLIGAILQEMSPGYTAQGRVIRAAKVIIGKE